MFHLVANGIPLETQTTIIGRRFDPLEVVMESTKPEREITASAAALRLGISRERVVRLVQRRELAGRRTADGTWLVHVDAVEALRLAREEE